MSKNSKEGGTTFTVIAISQPASLAQVLVDSLGKAGFSISAWSSGCKSMDWGSIPLLLCDNREELQQSGIMSPYEFTIEQQDLVPIMDDKGKMVGNPLDLLFDRLKTLAKLYGGTDFKPALQDWFSGTFRMALMLDATTHGNSQFVDLDLVEKRDDPILKVLAGLDDVRKNEKTKKHADDLGKLFGGIGQATDEETKTLQALAKVLFPEYFEPWKVGDTKDIAHVGRSVVRALNLATPEERFEALCCIYCDRERQAKASIAQTDESRFRRNPVQGGNPVFIGPREHRERLPVAFGDRAKYVTPSGKLNLLLIDDNVDGSPFGFLAKAATDQEANEIEETEGKAAGAKDKEAVPREVASFISHDDWKLLRELFNVQPLQVDKNAGDVCETAAQCFRTFQKMGVTFDLILVDLCLGNNEQGADLAGYSMIRTVRGFFPGTPVVVYSRFSDMEHIARAFASGAKWFLVKGEEAKLPRHVLKLLKQVGWHREWRAIQNGSNHPDWDGEQASPFYQRFRRTPEWMYLTYKSLEAFPGRLITVKQMGGGISSAVTFKATKGIWVDGEPLQTPSILKIDTAYNTGMEYERYFRMIRPYIANEAGRVELPERVLNRSCSCIVYTFAGKQDPAHELSSMGDMLEDDVGCQTACDYETYRYALKCIFDEILPKIHGVSPELERGDIKPERCNAPKTNVQRTEVMDAFEWPTDWWDEKSRRTSFPNACFEEFPPAEFWKSYMLRLQPWARLTLDKVVTDGETNRLFMTQPTDGQAGNLPRKRLIFHNVMTDPFATLEHGKAGQRIIEAYTAGERKLVWLDGDVSDFVARFRKRVAPGTSLWLGAVEGLDAQGELLPERDARLEWLQATFEHAKEEKPEAQKDFIAAIGALACLKIAFEPKDYNLGFYIALQDAVLDIAKKVAGGKAKSWEMKCPVGIVHGDLNVGNIMLESRKHPPKEEAPDVTKTVSDVWLIDFARTRRDLIAHDFNVFFTSVLGELFSERLIGKEGKTDAEQMEYRNHLEKHFKCIVSAALKPQSKNEKGVPDAIRDDRRFTLIYRMLRRTHDAARDAGISQNMYLLTTALTCLYTLKIFLNKGCQVRLAAGYFATAWIAYDLLCKELKLENKMDKLKETVVP